MTSNQSREITDPVYGFILLESPEAEIVDSPFFLRLHGIKQLGLSCYEYPSANHSRYEHSLGTLHVANEILNALLSNKDAENKAIIRQLETPRARRLVRLCALLHDIGHGPFSHTLEELITRNPGHKVKLRRGHSFIRSIDLKLFGVLKRHPGLAKYVPRELAEHEDFTRLMLVREFERLSSYLSRDDPKLVWKLLEVFGAGRNGTKTLVRVIKAIVDGDIDADKIDYLLRDTHHVGFRHSSVDLREIVQNLRLTKLFVGDTVEWKIGVDPQGVLAVESLLLTRNRHYDTLATNPASRRFEMSFIKVLERALANYPENDVRKFIYSAYLTHSDDVLLEHIKHRFKTDVLTELEKATSLRPVLDARWARFLPNTRYDLYTVWRNGPLRKEFEEHLEKALTGQYGQQDFMVEVSYHQKLPATLLVSAIPGYMFLYDYSVLVRDFQEVQFRNGRINIYSKREFATARTKRGMESLVFPPNERGGFYDQFIKGRLAADAERVRKSYGTGKLDDQIARCRDLDRLLALLYLTDDIRGRLYDRYRIMNDRHVRRFDSLTLRTRLYEYVAEVTTDVRPNFLSYASDLKLHSSEASSSSPFYYCDRMYNDFQVLKSAGLISEVIRPQKLGHVDGSFACIPTYLHFANVNALKDLFNPSKRPLLSKQLDELQGSREKLTTLYESIVLGRY